MINDTVHHVKLEYSHTAASEFILIHSLHKESLFLILYWFIWATSPKSRRAALLFGQKMRSSSIFVLRRGSGCDLSRAAQRHLVCSVCMQRSAPIEQTGRYMQRAARPEVVDEFVHEFATSVSQA